MLGAVTSFHMVKKFRFQRFTSNSNSTHLLYVHLHDTPVYFAIKNKQQAMLCSSSKQQ